jgi:hypothetical protein
MTVTGAMHVSKSTSFAPAGRLIVRWAGDGLGSIGSPIGPGLAGGVDACSLLGGAELDGLLPLLHPATRLRPMNAMVPGRRTPRARLPGLLRCIGDRDLDGTGQ